MDFPLSKGTHHSPEPPRGSTPAVDRHGRFLGNGGVCCCRRRCCRERRSCFRGVQRWSHELRMTWCHWTEWCYMPISWDGYYMILYIYIHSGISLKVYRSISFKWKHTQIWTAHYCEKCCHLSDPLMVPFEGVMLWLHLTSEKNTPTFERTSHIPGPPRPFLSGCLRYFFRKIQESPIVDSFVTDMLQMASEPSNGFRFLTGMASVSPTTRSTSRVSAGRSLAGLLFAVLRQGRSVLRCFPRRHRHRKASLSQSCILHCNCDLLNMSNVCFP